MTYNRWIKSSPINKEDSELVGLVRGLCIENKYRYEYCKITHLVKQKYNSKDHVKYLSSILDLYNREIIAYTISDKQHLECVLDTLSQIKVVTEGCILYI